jgi:hypothetical protein
MCVYNLFIFRWLQVLNSLKLAKKRVSKKKEKNGRKVKF